MINYNNLLSFQNIICPINIEWRFILISPRLWTNNSIHIYMPIIFILIIIILPSILIIIITAIIIHSHIAHLLISIVQILIYFLKFLLFIELTVFIYICLYSLTYCYFRRNIGYHLTIIFFLWTIILISTIECIC